MSHLEETYSIGAMWKKPRLAEVPKIETLHLLSCLYAVRSRFQLPKDGWRLVMQLLVSNSSSFYKLLLFIPLCKLITLLIRWYLRFGLLLFPSQVRRLLLHLPKRSIAQFPLLIFLEINEQIGAE